MASSTIPSLASARNFLTYSLIWHEVHMTYLQICVEGGIPGMILYLMFFSADLRI